MRGLIFLGASVHHMKTLPGIPYMTVMGSLHSRGNAPYATMSNLYQRTM